jgi:peptide/nickel transport system permease protein
MRRREVRRVVLPAALVGALVLVALFAPMMPLANPVRMEVAARLAPPSSAHLLGQDEYGRDVLSRIVWGARVSLSVAFMSALIAGGLGTVLGLLGGYFRGLVELVTVRPAEAILCFPPILLALLVVTLMGPGAGTLVIALSFLYAPGFARVAYAETLSVRGLDYVTAQEALGARPRRILARTILPNVAPPLIVQFSLTVASAMVLESGLSFLGLGVVPPDPSWGLMIRGARGTMEQAPWLLLWPCIALTGVVLVLNLLCDRLRDLLDPRAAAAAVSVLGRIAAPLLAERRPPADERRLLSVQDLTLEIGPPASAIRAVRDVSLDVAPGETVALVGESGSGKTLTGLAAMGLLPAGVRLASGRVLLETRNGTTCDLVELSEPERRRLRGNEIAMVFQDPSSSLNPVHRVGDQIAEAVLAHRTVPSGAAKGEAVTLLESVGMPDSARRARAFPHELSGGQRQRVTIAMAVANRPRLLIADEPTTALDVTIQAQILDLFADLKARDSGMGLIFVTHNLAVVAQIADRVCVIYAGVVVETGRVSDVFSRPRHPYTAALLAGVPESEAETLAAIPGAVPSPHEVPAGCPFAPRCPHATEPCLPALPALADAEAGHMTRCIRWREVA